MAQAPDALAPDPLAPEATAPPTTRGIGFKLFLAFCAVAMTTVLAAGIAWREFDGLGARFDQVVESDIPEMVTARRLVEAGAGIGAAATALQSARSQEDSDRFRADLRRQATALRLALSQLATQRLSDETLDVLDSRVDELETNLEMQRSLADRWITLLEASEALLRDIRQTREEVGIIIGPMMSVAAGEETRLNRGGTGIEGAPTRSLATPYLLFLVGERANDIALSLVRAATIRDSVALQDLRQRFERQMRTLRDQVGQINSAEDRVALTELAEALARLGHREVGIFGVRGEQLSSLEVGTSLLTQNQSISNGIRQEVNRLVARIVDSVRGSAQESARRIGNSKTLLLILAVGAPVLAFGVVWLYVNRDVVARIRRLSGVMRELSAGRLDVEVPKGGRDEIGVMANALHVFRDTAKRYEVARTDAVAARERAESALEDLQGAQQSLIQAEKMASLGELVAGVAHEINTPVGIALTAASHMRESAETMQDELNSGRMRKSVLTRFLADNSEASGVVMANLSRAAELIASFKQVAVDQSRDDVRTFDLQAYLEEILANLRPALKRTKHRVTVDCPEGLNVTSNPGAMSQVLTNMVMNSLIHGFAEIESGRISIVARESETGFVDLRYSDDGHGIPDALQAKVFDPFFTTRRATGGTGLGLNIVHTLVTGTLGGTVSLESSPGHGVTFLIRFPKSIQDKHGAAAD